MKRSRAAGLIFGASFLAMLTAASNTHAAPIRVRLTATLAEVNDPFGLLGGALSVGDVVTGSYLYESTTVDSNSSANVGDYIQSTPPYGVVISAGSLTFQTDPARVNFWIEIVNDLFGRDTYLFRSYNNLALPNGVLVDDISWQLDDPSATALSSTDLPTLPPNLASWQSIVGLTITGRDPANSSKVFFLRAHVTTATLAGDLLCALTATVADASMTLTFHLGTPVPTVFNTWVSFGNATVRLWSVPIPAISPPTSYPWTLPNPRIGKIGFLMTLVTGEGISCSDWLVVDTGTSIAGTGP